MVTKSTDCPVREQCLRDGKGTTRIKDLADKPALYNHARMFAHLTLEPGRSIGPHDHQHETEFFYILKGEGQFNDDGTVVTVRPGDVCATGYGASHSLENTSDQPLEFIALIMLEE